MSLLWADGFGWTAAAAGVNVATPLSMYYTVSGVYTTTAVAGRAGRWGLATGTNDGTLRVLPGTYTTLIVGARLGQNVAGSNDRIRFFVGGSVTLLVRLDYATGSVSVVRGSTVLGTSAGGLFTTATWDHWEVKVVFSQTVGTYEVRLNGVAVLTGTGADTCNSATEGCDSVQLWSGDGAYYADFTICDDAVIDADNPCDDFLGDVEVQARLPDADGSQEDWTPSTGADSYALVDEVPHDSDATYLETSTSGHVSRFLHEDVDADDTILAVVQAAVCRKTDAGSGSARLHQYSGAVAYNGPTQALSTSYQPVTQILETDPATGAAWTPAGVNAAEFGVEAVI